MRPLRKGAARSALAAGLNAIAHKLQYGKLEESVADGGITKMCNAQAAILGGAVEAAIDDIHQGMNPKYLAEFKRDFWRLTNENTWRLTRALAASRLLDKVGET